MLAYGQSLPEGYYPLPEDGFCRGWTFDLGRHFAASLDIGLRRRRRGIGPKIKDPATGKMKQKKESYYVWTQGAGFGFDVGYTVNSKARVMLQVISATLATGAKPQKNETNDNTDGGMAIETEDKFTDRNPGQAQVQFYRAKTIPGTWEKTRLVDMTQDDLVRLLITGMHKGEVFAAMPTEPANTGG